MSDLFIESSIYINFCLQRDWSVGVFPKKPYDFLHYYYSLLDKSKDKYRLDGQYLKLRIKKLYDKSYRSNLFVHDAKKYATLFHNNLWMHSYRRISKFFSFFTSDRTLIFETMDYLFNSKSKYSPSPLLLENAKLYLNYDGLMKFVDIQSTTNYFKYIEFFYNLQRFNQTNNIKNFKLVPQLKHRLHHCNYDSFGFYHLLKSLKLIESSAASMPNEEWYKYFPKLKDCIERKDKLSFGYNIKTDGVSISFSMNRYDCREDQEPQKKKKKNDTNNTQNLKKNIQKRLANNEYKCFVDLDPGCKLMFGGVRQYTSTKTFELIKIKSSHYHHLVGRKKKKAPDKLEESVVPPSDFILYTKHRLQQFEEKLKIYSTWRKTRRKFQQYQDSERCSAILARRLVDGGSAQRMKNQKIKYIPSSNRSSMRHKTLVLVGDTEIAANSIIKGYVRTPNRRVLKHLANIADIVRVNEFRTTKLCSNCFEPAETSKSPHRYQICRNCGSVWNRDVNAGKNILQLGVNHQLLDDHKALHPNFLRTTKLLPPPPISDAKNANVL